MPEKTFKTLAEIRSAGPSLKKMEVWVEEFRTYLHAHQLGALEFKEFRRHAKVLNSHIQTEGEDNVTAEDLVPLLALSLKTAAGEVCDAELLMTLPETTLAKLAKEVMKANGIGKEATEELEKNSETRDGEASLESPTPSVTPTQI